MHHRNSPLSFEGRRRLVQRCQTRPIAHVAAEMGISRACASKWVNRYRRHGELGLYDRSSAPHRQPTATREIDSAVSGVPKGPSSTTPQVEVVIMMPRPVWTGIVSFGLVASLNYRRFLRNALSERCWCDSLLRPPHEVIEEELTAATAPRRDKIESPRRVPGFYRSGMQIVVTLDCVDIEAQAGFWLAALAPLEYRRGFEGPPYLSLVGPAPAPILLLQRVAESKQVKNRMHLDLDFDTEDLDTEVDRLQQLGARRISREQSEHGFRWVVVADPEGNEFCVFVPPTIAVPET